MLTSAAPTYVVYTKPQSEEIAQRHLIRQQYDVLLPRVMFKGKAVPMFPRYLLVSDPLGRGLSRAFWAVGVVELLGGFHPTPLPQGQVDLIRSEMDNDSMISLNAAGEIVRAFLPGDEVNVINGPFLNERGVCLWTSPKTLRMVMLGMLAGVEVSFPLSHVAHAPG